MKREHYAAWYRLDNSDHYLLWCEDHEPARVHVNENGFVPSFRDVVALRRYANAREIVVNDEAPTLLDLDALRRWMRFRRLPQVNCEQRIGCNVLLGAWNVFDDVSRSVGGDFDSNRAQTNRVYQKLFWGCNLPAMTPEGCCYVPLWSSAERKLMRVTLQHGLQLFRRAVRAVRE